MKTRGLLTFGLALALASCDGPETLAPVAANVPSSPTPTPIPGPPTSAALLPLVGRYRLAIELPASCAALPDAERIRTYEADFKATPYNYLSASVTGSGYSTARAIGDLWGTPQALALKWNLFDIDCGGPVEELADGRAMMLCGVANGSADTAGDLSLTFAGTVWTGASEGAMRQSCALAAQAFHFSRLR